MPGTNSSQQTPNAIHQAITFIADEAKNAPYAELADRMHALTNGLHLCLELIESSNTDRECGGDLPPVLGIYDTGRMMRFAVATAGAIAAMAEEQLNAINHNAKAAKGGNHGS